MAFLEVWPLDNIIEINIGIDRCFQYVNVVDFGELRLSSTDLEEILNSQILEDLT